MEIIFFLIAIISTLIFIYFIGRLFYNHKELIKSYKYSELLLLSHTVLGMTMILTIFTILCAMNNTFWHIPYLTK